MGMNLDKSISYNKLLKEKPYDIKTLSGARVKECSIVSGPLTFNYACSPIDKKHISVFEEIVDECEVFSKFNALLSGERVNRGENRAVLHHLLRGNVTGKKVVIDGVDKEEFYSREKERIFEYAHSVRDGKILGSTGKRINTVVQIGIGGSDLGPRAMCIALSSYARSKNIPIIEPKFISNVDPEDADSVMSKVDPETTLFILVSKSGTTLETLSNKDIVREIATSKVSNKKFDFNKHLICVTSETSPLAKSNDNAKVFFMDDYIGGRYSSTSGVGLLIICLAYGEKIGNEFLKGAFSIDRASYTDKVENNAALLDAFIGVYERNALNMTSLAVLPYSEALLRFTAHLEQLDMESNGKSVNKDGEYITYQTGPVIFGECGTNGQHSFYQHLHQSLAVTPIEFIAFKNNSSISPSYSYAESMKNSHTKLNANVVAQMVAFAKGSANSDNNKNFEGGRPSCLLYADELTPFTLGALLSHFENKVMFQGFIWNLNSFDQEGVQLGKKLATSLLNNTATDTALLEFSKILM